MQVNQKKIKLKSKYKCRLYKKKDILREKNWQMKSSEFLTSVLTMLFALQNVHCTGIIHCFIYNILYLYLLSFDASLFESYSPETYIFFLVNQYSFEQYGPREEDEIVKRLSRGQCTSNDAEFDQKSSVCPAVQASKNFFD